jgi:hypothetical protein
VLIRVGEKRDAELQLRQPPQVGQEAVPAAAVGEQVEVLAGPPVRAGDAERVAGRRARVWCGDGAHLLHQCGIKYDVTVDAAVAQQELQEPGEVRGAGPQPAGRRHRDIHGRRYHVAGVTDRPVGAGVHLGPVEGAVVHAQRCEQRGAHGHREGLVRDLLEDVAGEVDPEIGVGVAGADREPQPGVGDAPSVRIEVAGLRPVVVAQPRFVGEASGVAEQHAQRDPLLGVRLEGAVHGESGQVVRDRLVEVELSGLDGLHHRRGGEHLGHRLDAEDGVDRDRRTPVAVGGAEPLLPHDPVAVDHRQSQPRDVLAGHQLGEPGLVAGDDRGDAVARDGCRHGGRTTRRRRA